MQTPPKDAELDHAVGVLRLLGDRTRLAILAMLDGTEMSVTAIAESLGRPVPAVSQHLAKLRSAGLVKVRKEGVTSYYTQPDEHLAGLVTNALELAEHALYLEPPHHRK
ncbi:MAG: winged helix-turn-helix transcriptional regulator [Propionibacterium sp.]|nr:winged helix-turn-helix transcriptional regulator [Propionibacterium sp.]